VRYDEIRQTITASSPDDWAVVAADGLTFLARFGEVRSQRQHWLETDSHICLAVYRADIDLRLAWGLTVGTGLEFDGFNFADASITRQAVDGLWRGALVTRWYVLSVDGHRCYLPDPHPADAETGEGVRGSGTVRWTAKEGEVALARLLQAQVHEGGRDFDSYMDQAGIVEVPDE
jgi:hypothetical protein